MSGLRREQGGNRWDYPSVDELVDACERVDQIADQLRRLVQAYVVRIVAKAVVTVLA
jgi:hypothetical protein